MGGSGLPPAINERKRPVRAHKRGRRDKKKDIITKTELRQWMEGRREEKRERRD